MKTEPVQDYILKNEQNLRIAAAVAEAWLEARQKLVTGFLDRLEARLRKKCKGWRFERWERYFVDRYPSFYFWKPAWQAQYDEPQYYVNLQLNSFGEQMVFGLSRNVKLKHIAKRPRCAAVLAAIRRVYPSATDLNWWEACVNMHSPASDWRKPEVLWRMHKDPKFLKDVAEQLLGVARISEPFVDRLVELGGRKIKIS